MRINVTKRDIAKGVPGDAQNCPIACALKRAGFKGVRAYYSGVCRNVRKNPTSFDAGERADLPNDVHQTIKNFMLRFDGGHGTALEPFSFEVPWKKPRKSVKKAKARK